MKRLALLPLLLLALPAPAQPQTLAARLQSAAKTGGVIILTENERNFAASVTVARGRTLTVKALRPVTLDGGGAEYGLRVNSGGRVVLAGPITWRNYSKNAIRCTLAESLTIDGNLFADTGQAAVLTGKCKAVRIERTTVQDSASHGLYVSEGGSSVVIRGNVIRRCGSIGIHINACRYRATNVSVLSNTILDCGNSAIQIAAVTGAVIAGNSFARCRQGVVVFNDSRASCRCVNIDLRQQVGPYNIHRSSIGVRLPPGARVAAGQTSEVQRRPAN